MNLLTINKESCVKDGICAAVCPANIILFKNGEYPVPVKRAEEYCIRCGHCVAVCPTASLSHIEMHVEDCPPIKKELIISREQSEQFLRSRRSIRAYKEKSVPQNELEKLIELARFAPTGANSQTVEWLVLGNRDELKHLAGITVDWMRWFLEDMPEAAKLMRLDKTISRWEEGKDVIFRNAPNVIVTHAPKDDPVAPGSSLIAMSYLELAATSMGLGCCWAGYFHRAAATFPPMLKTIPLPKGHQCTGAMMVGYPRFSYQRLPLRKEPEIIWRL